MIRFQSLPSAAKPPEVISLRALIVLRDIGIERAILLNGNVASPVTPLRRMVQGITQQLLALEGFYGGGEGRQP